MNRLYLVRHGENYANLTKEFSYRKIDYPLTEKGILQAEQTAKFFADRDISELYSSPLLRARQTAAIIGKRLGLPVAVLENLREMNVGELEGMADLTRAWTICGHVWQAWSEGKDDVAFPGGENRIVLSGRMLQAIRQITAGKDSKNFLVVGHGGIFTASLPELCPNAGAGATADAPSHNCSITEILLENLNSSVSGQLVSWASFSHLSGPAADLVNGVLQVEEAGAAAEPPRNGD